MILRAISVIIFGIIILTASNTDTQHKDALIPREILFAPADKFKVDISHDGKYISYLEFKSGRLDLWIADSNDVSNIKTSINEKAGVNYYIWVHDNQHILYAKDKNHNENYQLYSYDLKTSSTKLLTPGNETTAQIVATSVKKPHEILIGIKQKDKHYFDVYKLNFLDYSKKLIIKNDRFSTFIADQELNVRLAVLMNDKGEKEYFQLKNNDWVFLMKMSAEDSANSSFYDFDHTGNNVYLFDSRGRDTTALKILNLNDGELKIVAENQLVDVNFFTRHPTDKKIQAVTVNYDKVAYEILDDSIKADMEYLKKISLGNIHIIHRIKDDQVWLIAFSSDINPIKYYKYDRRKRQVKFLFSSKTMLEQYNLAHMTPIIIKSRDGLDLVSYITLPRNITLSKQIYENKPISLVLLVHGGPAERDLWEMNLTHQWLANRGYAVLSVNFRGSTGFGKNFLNAGNGQWGKKMQDDLIDAVNWVIKNRIADPKKIAIMGTSYGGYAVLAGLTFTPNIFACGIDTAGPSDLLAFLDNLPNGWKLKENLLKAKIGPWQTPEQREKLRQQSPLTFASNITKPLLIAQGANDPRVRPIQSEQIVTEMIKHNIPVIYALYKNDGHGFSNPYNRLSFFAIAEQFLAKHLGGIAEPINDEYLRDNPNLLLNGQPPSDKLLRELLLGLQ